MRRTIATTALALTLAVAATATAVAANGRGPTRTDGSNVSAYWTQVDGPPAAGQPFGNVHVGYIDAYKDGGDTYAWASVDDFSCPAGELPSHGGGHGDEKVDEGNDCTWVGTRYGDGEGMQLTTDRKLSRATLTGTLVMTADHDGHGGGGEVVGRPPVNMTFAGTGGTYRSSGTWREQYERASYMDRYSSTNRNATVTGNIGPMGFDPALSGGSISTYRSMYMSRSR